MDGRRLQKLLSSAQVKLEADFFEADLLEAHFLDIFAADLLEADFFDFLEASRIISVISLQLISLISLQLTVISP